MKKRRSRNGVNGAKCCSVAGESLTFQLMLSGGERRRRMQLGYELFGWGPEGGPEVEAGAARGYN